MTATLSDPVAVLPYALPDADLLRPEGPAVESCAWRPEQLCVVIGRGNEAGASLAASTVAARGIPVYRRPSGGEAVVLSPGMAAAALAFRSDPQPASKDCFLLLNGLLRDALAALGATGVRGEGISDLTLGGRKISGSAIYRNRRLVFVHAILNVTESPLTLENLLQMPGRMPDYRAGRSHRDFVTSLRAEGFPLSPDAVVAALRTVFAQAISAPGLTGNTTRL